MSRRVWPSKEIAETRALRCIETMRADRAYVAFVGATTIENAGPFIGPLKQSL